MFCPKCGNDVKNGAQFSQSIKLSQGKAEENFTDEDVREFSSKMGSVLSEFFSRDNNLEQLAESVTGRSYFEAEKAKKKDGIVSAAVTVHYLDIPDINRQVIKDSTSLSELTKLIKNRSSVWMGLSEIAFGDVSFILDRFEEKAGGSTADKTYTGTVEFTYNKEEKSWEISSVDSGLLDAWIGHMGLFDTIKENTNLVRGGSSQPAGKFDQQIEAVEGKIRETLIQIGIVYLEKHREDCEPEYKGFIQQIKDLEEQKETLERNKLAAQGLRMCEHCRQIITLDSVFCNKCGSKLEPLEISSAGGRFCPSCGASLAEGDAFCTACGSKVN